MVAVFETNKVAGRNGDRKNRVRQKRRTRKRRDYEKKKWWRRRESNPRP